MNNQLDTNFEQVEPQRQTLTTSCKDCIFATKEDKLQTGCSFGRIEAYSNRGINIIEAEDLEENEFFVLETWCNAYREELWKTAHEEEGIEEALRKELDPKVQFIIVIQNSLDGIEKTVQSALNQEEFTPKRLVFVNNSDTSYFEVITKINEIVPEGTDYRIQDIRGELSDLEVIDEAFNNISNGYYTVIESGRELPSDIIKKIYNAISVNIQKLGYINPTDGINLMTAQAVIHKFLYGNRGASLKTKIEDGEVSDKVKEGNSLIRNWDEI
tara:strand:+ start:1499 stop:2311 length:813 start_codon:yes stop_codon:yes gene_type:complete